MLLIMPSVSEAGSRDWSVDRDEIDDEVVEKFPIPVLFGVDYEDINPDFHDSRDNGDRAHEGEDFLAPLGTPIVSPTEAIVIRTGEGDSAGKYVYLAAPGGETFRFMHLDHIATNLDREDVLEPGDFIGTVGDTGNAPEGVYHLHFEVRDEDNEAIDPYPRIDEDGFTLREKISFMSGVFKGIRNDDDYAELLVENFRDEMREALDAGYNMPDELEDAIEDAGVVSQKDQFEALEHALRRLPLLINDELKLGDSNLQVTVLQMYLLYMSDGPARDRLRAAGVTGYYGSITEAAVVEYQKNNLLVSHGVFETKTKQKMLSNDDTLNLF